MKPCLALLAIAALVLPAHAQSPIPLSFPHVVVDQPGVASPDYDYDDDGVLHHVWSTTITAGEDNPLQWMRVFFDRVNIGADDYLTFTSVQDGWSYSVRGSQIYPHGVKFVDDTYSSLFMTGNSVTIDLWAQSGSHGGGVSVDYVHVGVPRNDERDVCVAARAEYAANYDYRVGRVVAFRSVPLFGGDQYLAGAGALLFPGSCFVTSAEALDRVELNDDDVIVEFGDGLGADGQSRSHPHPNDQYRLLEASDCVGPARGRVLSFRLRSNENTGDTPGYSYADNPRGYWFGGLQCTQPAVVDHGDDPVDPISVVGWLSDTIRLSDNQYQDVLHVSSPEDGQDFIRFADHNGDLEHDSDVATWGFEGGPILDDRLVNADLEPLPESERKFYGIHTHTNCGLVDTHFGVSWWDPDMDLDSPSSCVDLVCNDVDNEYPMINGGVARHLGDSWESYMTLPGGPMTVRGSGVLDFRQLIRQMTGDGLWDVRLGVSRLQLDAVGCTGPVEVRLYPPLPATGRIQQLTNGSLYPASGSLEIPVEIVVAGQVLHTPVPARLAATLYDANGFGDTYTLVAPVPLANAQGQEVGTLDSWTNALEAPRSSQYALMQLSTGSLGTLTLGGSIDITPRATVWSESTRTWVTPIAMSALHVHTALTGIGTVLATEADGPASLGLVRYPFLPDTFPAQTALDVYLEVRQQNPPRVLVNHDPFRLTGTWKAYPPVADTLRSQGAVALYDRATNQLVTTIGGGWLVAGDPITTTPYPPAGTDAFCASGQLTLDVGQGPQTIGGLLGRAVMWHAEPHPEPAEPDPEPALSDTLATELRSMDLEMSASPLGFTIVRLHGLPATSGQIQQQEAEVTYPATSFFDVFLEIQSGIGTLHNAQPFRIQADIGSIPPTEQYANMPTQPAVPLLDASGQTRGLLYAFSFQPGTPYDAACPSRISCSPVPVGVDGSPGSARVGLQLYPASPNPARDAVSLAFDLPRDGDATLGVYDVAGRLVREITRGAHTGGVTHRLEWNGTDRDGRRVSSGVYFLRLQAEGRTLSRTVILER